MELKNSPNLLIEKCLEEMIKKAKDPHIQNKLKIALTELKKYPLPLKSGRECIIIRGFGRKICEIVDSWLDKNQKNSMIVKKKINPHEVKNKLSNSKKVEAEVKQNINFRVKEPEPGSSEWALLLTIYIKSKEENFPGHCFKKDIIKESMAKFKIIGAQPDKQWGFLGMGKLVEKKLINRKGSPAQYSITDAGTLLADKLMKNTSDLNNFLLQKLNIPLKVINNDNDIETISSDSDEEFNQFCKENPEPKIITPKKKANFIITQDVKDFSNCSKTTPESKLSAERSPISFQKDSSEYTKIVQNSPTVSSIDLTDSFDEFPDCSELMKLSDVPSVEPRKIIEETLDCPDSIKKSPIILPIKSQDTKESSNCFTLPKMSSVLSSVECTLENNQFFLLPNNVDIVLLVDKQETCGSKTKPKDDETISELTKTKVPFEVRSLKVGDFAWIAKCRLTNKELILPYIVERKTLEDLSSSIKDGRYHEQKFRLSQCGIKNVIYMIENYGSTYRGGIPLTSLLQAGANSLIQDEFNLQFTKNHKESIQYLSTITEELTKIYEAKELISCQKEKLDLKNKKTTNGVEYLMVFEQFNKSAAKYKNYTVQNLLVRQLIKLCGLSAEKAVAIAKHYPTPCILARAFQQGGENILANISVGASKKIGPSISKTLYLLYSKHELN